MRKTLIGMVLLTLSACGGTVTHLPVTPAAVIPPPVAVPATHITTAIKSARSLCVEGQSLLTLATLVPGENVATIVAYVQSVCDGLLAGQVPPTLDQNTPNWLIRNLNSLAALVPK